MPDYNFSLIIPHYNSVELLSRLLFSIPKRDDLQIIVVDDCSSKNIQELDRIRNQYPHIAFLSTSINGGGGKARNIGLENAKGKYVFFADSDDYFTPGINLLLDRYSKKGEEYDLIFFNAQAVNSDTYQPSRRVNHLNRYISLYSSNPKKSILKLRFLFGEPWCKLINRNLIDTHHIKFDELPVHNDTFFSYMTGFYAKSFDVSNIVGYCVTERPVSVSTFRFGNRLLIKAEVFAKKNRFLANNNIDIFDDLMIVPFRLADRENSISKKELYSIVKKYKYSKIFIIKEVIIYPIKKIASKLLRILKLRNI